MAKKQLIRKLFYFLGLTDGTKRYGIKEGPLTDILTVSDKRIEKRNVGGHPCPAIESIIKKGCQKYIYTITFSSSSRRKLKVEDEIVFNSLDINDEVKATYYLGFLADYNYVPPKFDEKKEIKRVRDPYWDTLVRLEKTIDQKSLLIDLSKLNELYHSRDTFDIQGYWAYP